MRVALINRSFDGIYGGVEAQSLWLANALQEVGHQVVVISWDKSNAATPFDVHGTVQMLTLGREDPNHPASFRERLRRHWKLRREFRAHGIEVAIAYQQGSAISAILSATFLRTRVIAAERNSPQLFGHIRGGRERKALTFLLLFADAVVIQFARYAPMYPRSLQSSIRVIPNPVHPPREHESTANSETLQSRLLVVGRLSFQKNQADAIKGLALLLESGDPSIEIHFLGSGETLDSLQRLALSLGLENHVKFIAPVVSWHELLLSYDAVLVPSLWEGFPNAVAETLVRGWPVLGFNTCDGLSDLIVSGVNGVLAPGPPSPEGVCQLIRTFYSLGRPPVSWKEAAQSSVSAYKPEQVLREWQRTLDEVSE